MHHTINLRNTAEKKAMHELGVVRGGFGGLNALTYLPGIEQAIAAKRPFGIDKIPPIVVSQALQSWLTRQRDEEGIQ